MVDENHQRDIAVAAAKKVQIPLWSMKTTPRKECGWLLRQFRFLYGRWKRLAISFNLLAVFSSDSSMVDENKEDYSLPIR